MTVRIEPLTGADRTAALPALAELRIKVFRAWPYLYEGTLDYEQKYLKNFAAADGAILVAARDGEKIVGVATASPITGHMAEFAAPFERLGHDLGKLFYFGESVLLPEYRGQGIGHAFFDAREAHARSFGRYTHATFCGVVRPADHPLRDPAYRPLEPFWSKRGYRKLDGVVTEFAWKDVGDSAPTKKPMQYWIKEL